MSRRNSIVDSLVVLLKTIDGTGDFSSNLYTNVENGLKFWDEVNDFPYVFAVPGDETRQYEASDFKWGFLAIPIKIYVKADNPAKELEDIMEDIENVVDANNGFEYSTGKKIEDMQIISITTDQGLLRPIGVGEMVLQIRYEVL